MPFLQRTLRPLDHGRSAIKRRLYNATDENSNDCLIRFLASIKEVSRFLVPACYVGNTTMWGAFKEQGALFAFLQGRA
jgi:hypothetical protein